MRHTLGGILLVAVGALLMPVLWVVLHYWVGVEERYLPSPLRVVEAAFVLDPSVFTHGALTAFRLLVGFILGLWFGLVLGLVLYRYVLVHKIIMPSLQALRAVPAIATVPFFLLWFGFSEIGRYLVVVLGVSLSLAVALLQILDSMPEKYAVLFRGFSVDPHTRIIRFAAPFVVEKLLPTVRFSLSTALSLVVVSELLGAQLGLGHLIQTARATFSIHVIVLATTFLAFIMFAVDRVLISTWQASIFWRRY